jgi:hypothetical protein
MLGGDEVSAEGVMLGGDEVSRDGKSDGIIVGAEVTITGTGGRDANATKEARSKVGSIDGAGEGSCVGSSVTGCSDGAIDGRHVKRNEGNLETANETVAIATGADVRPGDGTLVFWVVDGTVAAFRGTGVVVAGVSVTGPTLGFVASGTDGARDSNGCVDGGGCSGAGVKIGGRVSESSLESEVVGIAKGPMLIADGCPVGAPAGPTEAGAEAAADGPGEGGKDTKLGLGITTEGSTDGLMVGCTLGCNEDGT